MDQIAPLVGCACVPHLQPLPTGQEAGLGEWSFAAIEGGAHTVSRHDGPLLDFNEVHDKEVGITSQFIEHLLREVGGGAYDGLDPLGPNVYFQLDGLHQSADR